MVRDIDGQEIGSGDLVKLWLSIDGGPTVLRQVEVTKVDSNRVARRGDPAGGFVFSVAGERREGYCSDARGTWKV